MQFKNHDVIEKHEFYESKPGVKKRDLIKQMGLIEWHLLVRIANNEKFKCSQFEVFFIIFVFLQKTR